jgi:hypothetical protein
MNRNENPEFTITVRGIYRVGATNQPLTNLQLSITNFTAKHNKLASVAQ